MPCVIPVPRGYLLAGVCGFFAGVCPVTYPVGKGEGDGGGVACFGYFAVVRGEASGLATDSTSQRQANPSNKPNTPKHPYGQTNFSSPPSSNTSKLPTDHHTTN